MSVWDIKKNMLAEISEKYPEELVFRLAQAELAKNGANISCANWSGHENAADGGIDVRVSCPKENFVPGFIKTAETVFQIKRSNVFRSMIDREMRPNGILRPFFEQLSKMNGTYIIVSYTDKTSPQISELEEEMEKVVKSELGEVSIQLCFYDLSMIHQWILEHPTVQLWVREKLKQPLEGWRPYGNWSNAPESLTEYYEMGNGISFRIPRTGNNYPVYFALPIVRSMIHNSKNSIRIVGLSGVGKTRFLQVLFDEGIGQFPLNKDQVIYVDIEAHHIPPPESMIDQLQNLRETGYIIVDNCSSEQHMALVNKLNNSDSIIKLITVDYHTREEILRKTDIILMEAIGIDVTTKVVKHHFPEINIGNALKLADFAGGNVGFAILMAEKIDEYQSLAHFDTDVIFKRVFFQRMGDNEELLKHAEVLSLFYSFRKNIEANKFNELGEIGKIIDVSEDDLYRTVSTLIERQMIKSRGEWSAILPQALANRLAKYALKNISPHKILNVLAKPKNRELLISFAQRLGLMHNIPDAQEIVQKLFGKNGIISKLDRNNIESWLIFLHISPVAKNECLSIVENYIKNSKNSTRIKWHTQFIRKAIKLGIRLEKSIVTLYYSKISNKERKLRPPIMWYFLKYFPQNSNKKYNTKIYNLLMKIILQVAYDREYFNKCMNLLVYISISIMESKNYNVNGFIMDFFRPYHSGTIADIKQRQEVVIEMLSADDHLKNQLGTQMLSTALQFSNRLNPLADDFSSQPKETGNLKDDQQLTEWLDGFIEIVSQFGRDSSDKSEKVKETFISSIFRLWQVKPVRDKIASIILSFGKNHTWKSGFQSLRKSILDLTFLEKQTGQDYEVSKLVEVEKEIRPKNTIDWVIHTLTSFSDEIIQPDFKVEVELEDSELANLNSDYSENLGKEFARSSRDLNELGVQLFLRYCGKPHVKSGFGRGLCIGANDRSEMWKKLVSIYDKFDPIRLDVYVFDGFLEKLAELDPDLDEEVSNSIKQHKSLSKNILTRRNVLPLNDTEIERRLIESGYTYTDVSDFEYLFRTDVHKKFTEAEQCEFARSLFEKSYGEEIVIRGLAERLHNSKNSDEPIGCELRKMALIGVSKWLGSPPFYCGKTGDHNIPALVEYCLRFDDNIVEKQDLVDEIIRLIDNQKHFTFYRTPVVQLVVKYLTKEFFDALWCNDKEKLRRRVSTLYHIGHPFLCKLYDDYENFIDWCIFKNDNDVWTEFCHLFDCVVPVKRGSNEEVLSYEISDLALAFIESCPNPEVVMYKIFERIKYEVGAIYQFNECRKQIDAFRPLIEHENQKIAKAAQKIINESERTFADNKNEK